MRPHRHGLAFLPLVNLIIYHSPYSIYVRIFEPMSHTIRGKDKLLNRVRRLGGQVQAIERALEAEVDCNEVMQLVVSARGAANGLMAELMEDHIRMHVADPDHDRDRNRAKGAEQLIEVLHAYLK